MGRYLKRYLKLELKYLKFRFLRSKSKIFLSILVAFIIGVAVYLWWRPDLNFDSSIIIFFTVSILLILIAIFWRRDIWIRYFALIFAFLFLGGGFTQFYFAQFLANPLNFDKKEVEFRGFICNDPEVGMQEVKYEVCLFELDKEKANFKILMTADLYPKYEFGQIISGQGNLERPGEISGFDYQSFLLTKKIFGVIYKPKISESPPAGEAGSESREAGSGFARQESVSSNDLGKFDYFLFQIENVLFKIKNKFEATINQIMVEPEASLLNGLILGEKSGMSEELINNFNQTGTTHIIALSGFNVTIIIWAVAGALAFLGKRDAFLISLFLVAAFVVMTGASSSVVRAAIMVMLVLVAPLLGRKAKSINILVLTAFVMILFNPLILRYDLGFALSFLSISGLALLSPLLINKFTKGKLTKIPGRIKSPLIETLSAQTFAFPLILYSFSRVSIIAPLTNVLILPFIPWTMGMGFVVGFVGIISKSLAEILAYFPFFFLKYMIVVVNLCAKIPFASIEIKKFPVILTILIYLVIIVSLSFLNRKIIIKNGDARIR